MKATFTTRAVLKVAFTTEPTGRGSARRFLLRTAYPFALGWSGACPTMRTMTTSSRRRSMRLQDEFPTGVAPVRSIAAALEISERTVYRRCLEGGPWQRVLPGIVLLFTGRATAEQLVHAALLLCGPDAIVTGIEGCRRHGLRRGPTRRDDVGPRYPEVHVLVPKHRQVRSVGFVHVERTTRMPTAIERGGVPLAPLSRCCTDAARRIRSTSEVTELLSEPVQRRLCTVNALWAELAEGSRRGTAVPRAVLADVADGVRSAAERAAKQLWASTGLPTPWWNAEVCDDAGRSLGIGDCWLDEVAMLWEIESSEWHLDPAAHEYTVRRAAQFTAAGVVYIASKPKMVLTDRTEVITTLRAAYAQARARPRPPLRASPARG